MQVGKYPEPIPNYNLYYQFRAIQEKAASVCYGAGLDIGSNPTEWDGGSNIKLQNCLTVDIHPGADFVGVAEDFPKLFGDRKFDYVFSSHTLEHIPNWKIALRHWVDIIRPGGVLFLYLPNPAVAPEWSHKNMPNFHHHDFTIDSIIRGMIEISLPVEIMECAYDKYAGFYIYAIKTN